ncbi:hypothetical protein SJ05684_c32060 [Sinorhizobium sojae CCBAU 05684]|uniref:Uncharacterized protein n=1 Tax=Sinorhizobium sojae CCBAU 05684 TaxID=716928 RepID=A0A249PH79_9HYPH|nr:hypothetical protein SJ05684_c32060 [Sinorhizobium sojae CCBAU 05684]
MLTRSALPAALAKGGIEISSQTEPRSPRFQFAGGENRSQLASSRSRTIAGVVRRPEKNHRMAGYTADP